MTMEIGKVQQIPLSSIDAGQRLRVVDEAHVAALAESIAELGLMQAIEVREVDGRYVLIAGAHRLEAARRCGLESVEVRVVSGIDDDEALLREIDENLARHDLNPLDRAASYAERKRVYEKLHPGAKNGAAGLQVIEKGQTAKIAIWTPALSFAAAAAQETGAAERSIRRAVQIYERLDPAVRARIAGTALARREGELFKLSALSPSEQARVADILLAKDGPAKKVKDAVDWIRDRRAVAPVTDKWLGRMIDGWGRGSARDRRNFLTHLHGRGEIKAFLAAQWPEDAE